MYTILTKLSTKLNVQTGNDKESYIEVGGLYTIGFLELQGKPRELRVLTPFLLFLKFVLRMTYRLLISIDISFSGNIFQAESFDHVSGMPYTLSHR